jgi:6-pyruvoyltetrahydropterin/6-carboxytetrahydropterin synthase
MYELLVERCFNATHALRVGGVTEPVHGHDWQVVVRVGAGELNADDLVMDFHELERLIDAALQPLQHANLSELPAFEGVNASAERVVKHLHDQIAPGLPAGVQLVSVTVTEAPGCRAVYGTG